MVQINHLFGLNKVFTGSRLRRQELPQKEIPLLEQGGGLDTVSFSTNKSEKFADVRAELDQNVPDRTTTIEEKEKAISYIDRMLNCDDITPEMKDYWANKKDIIQMEIQMIKNEQQAGKDSNYQNIVEEYNNFIQQHWCDNYPHERNEELEFLDSEEYGLTFYSTCISYLNRILACNNLPEEARIKYEQEINHWNAEKQSRLGEINWYNQNHGIKTESFQDVFEEFDKAIPDRTTTVEEKKLAAAYIKRMILCDDISPELKNYWQNKKAIIEMEMKTMENEQAAGSGEKIENVWKEFSEFTNKYFGSLNDNMSMEEKYENRVAYYNMYKSFINRFMGCTDITEEQRAEYMRMDLNADRDLFNWECDYQRYKDSQ